MHFQLQLDLPLLLTVAAARFLSLQDLVPAAAQLNCTVAQVPVVLVVT